MRIRVRFASEIDRSGSTSTIRLGRAGICSKMNKILAFLLVALFGTSCSSKRQFPWSLDGKAVPEFKICNKEDFSNASSVNYTVSVVVPTARSKEALTLVSQKIIEGLPKHSLVIVFFYATEREINGEFTVGKAWWGETDEEVLAPGDYSRHVLKVECKAD